MRSRMKMWAWRVRAGRRLLRLRLVILEAVYDLRPLQQRRQQQRQPADWRWPGIPPSVGATVAATCPAERRPAPREAAGAVQAVRHVDINVAATFPYTANGQTSADAAWPSRGALAMRHQPPVASVVTSADPERSARGRRACVDRRRMSPWDPCEIREWEREREQS